MKKFREFAKASQERFKAIANNLSSADADKRVSAAMLAGAVAGAIGGAMIASAFWPLAFAGGIAGSYILAVANWNGSLMSRALSAAIGFPLGAVFAVPMAGAMIGTAIAQNVAKQVLSVPADTLATDAPVAPSTEGSAKSGFSLSGLAARFNSGKPSSTVIPAPVADDNAPKPPKAG